MYMIIGGGGDIGYYLTKSLLSQGHEVLLLEKGAARYQTLSEELGPAVLRGDACEAAARDVAAAGTRLALQIGRPDDDEPRGRRCARREGRTRAADREQQARDEGQAERGVGLRPAHGSPG